MSSALHIASIFRRLHQGVLIPDYEKLLAQTYGSFVKPGDTIYDVGCHKGYHFEMLLSLIGPTGKAIGFEAIPHLVADLRKRFGTHRNAEIVEVALSDHNGKGTFKVAAAALGFSGLRERQTSGPTKFQDVQVTIATMDSFIDRIDRLDYIKIDIEGGEIDAIKGGLQTIRKFRPYISVEFGRPTYSVYGQTPQMLYDLATSLDYRIGDLFGSVIESPEEWNAVCDHAFWDYFLIPVEKIPSWTATLVPKP